MTAYEELKDRALRHTAEHNDIIMAEDGYYVYWPEGYERGYHDSASLRVLADILDEKNKPWDEQLHRELVYDKGISDTQED